MAWTATAGRLSFEFIRSRIARNEERLGALTVSLRRAFRLHVVNCRTSVDQNAKLLTSLGYQSVLARGFAVVRDRHGQTMKRKNDILENTALEIEFSDGRIQAQSLRDSDTDANASPAPTPSPQKRRSSVRTVVKANAKGANGQGSLF